MPEVETKQACLCVEAGDACTCPDACKSAKCQCGEKCACPGAVKAKCCDKCADSCKSAKCCDKCTLHQCEAADKTCCQEPKEASKESEPVAAQ